MTWKVKFLELAIRTLAWPMRKEITGIENIPKDGGWVAAANHNSLTDGLFVPQIMVTATGRPNHYISYSELFDIKVLGTVLRWGQGIVLDRHNKQGIEKMMEEARAYIRSGEGVGIFPEAHIAKPARMGIARPGAAILALESPCPVLPIGTIGTEVVMPRKGRFRPKWNAVTIHIGKPMSFTEYEKAYADGSDEDKKIILEGISTLIMRTVAELAGKEYTYGQKAVERLPEFSNAATKEAAS